MSFKNGFYIFSKCCSVESYLFTQFYFIISFFRLIAIKYYNSKTLKSNHLLGYYVAHILKITHYF